MPAPLAQNFDAKLHRAVWSKISREGLESIPRVHQTFLERGPVQQRVGAGGHLLGPSRRASGRQRHRADSAGVLRDLARK
jgi:hypothetical protein